MKYTDWRKTYDELASFKATEDSARLTRPQKPEDFKSEFPKEFKPPQGKEIKIDERNPALAQLRSVGIKHGLTQEAFSDLLAVDAANQLARDQGFEAAKAAEFEKAGAAATARVDAITTFLKAELGDDIAKPFAATLVTEAQIRGWEKIMARFRTQGQGTFTPQHGEVNPAGKLSDADYQKLSPSERLAYAAKFPQPAHQNGAAR